MVAKIILRTIAIITFVACATFAVAIAGPITGIKIQDKAYILDVLEKTEFPAVIKILNRAKESSSKYQENQIAEPIDNCTFMIDLPRGTATGNHSYGGYCETKMGKGVKPKHMIVCADVMVGHFKSELIEDILHTPQEINALAAFVAQNCTGG